MPTNKEQNIIEALRAIMCDGFNDNTETVFEIEKLISLMENYDGIVYDRSSNRLLQMAKYFQAFMPDIWFDIEHINDNEPGYKEDSNE